MEGVSGGWGWGGGGVCWPGYDEMISDTSGSLTS